MLFAAGIALEGTNGREVLSDWSPKFKGHIDGLTRTGDLLEIKSVSHKKFEGILEKGKCLHNHFVQIQLYMRYLHIRNTFIIYRDRETYEIKVFSVFYRQDLAEQFELRARSLMKAIEDLTPPECECGTCKK
jgi:hypothetical protein